MAAAATIVRTSDAPALARALAAADIVVHPTDDGALMAETTELARVGDVALAAGLPVWELRPKTADLEGLFLRAHRGHQPQPGAGTGRTGGRGGAMTGPSLPRSVHSELLKFFTTRLWWGMAIGVFLSAAGLSLLFALLYNSSAMEGDGAPVGDPTQVANSVYTAGLSVGYLLMLTIGVIQVGAEYRHRPSPARSWPPRTGRE